MFRSYDNLQAYIYIYIYIYIAMEIKFFILNTFIIISKNMQNI
jgi:hypothetical protein